ncbi:hypothetical protein HYT51_01810, partial [Candidatus Woesearchaeota archaeon]|nr:hypothetical protein [Candidatus Woesearchaeota archaeon]
ESNGEEEDETEIILAVNRPALELYHVDPYGNVNPVSTSEDLEYICLGSGSELAEGYIDEQDYKEDSYIPEKIRKEGISLDNVTIPIAGWLVINALRKARKDARTGGIIDIAVVTHDRIETIEPILRKRIEELEQEEYSEFLNKYETSADKEA